MHLSDADQRIPSANPAEIDRLITRLAANPWPEGTDPCRAHYDAMGAPVDPTVSQRQVMAGGVPGVMLTPECRTDAVVLFLHGGGYVFGSSRSHRGMAAQIAKRLRCRVLVLDYRRAPEHPCPAAIDDTVAAYRWLLASGVETTEISLVGDSAGGGLVISTLVRLRNAREPLPAAAVCLSPWVDLSLSGESYASRLAMDPAVHPDTVRFVRDCYLGSRPADDPAASPAFADLTGLPPLLIQVGEREILFSDAVMLRDRARAAGVDVTFEEWLGQIHVWQFYYSDLTDAHRALDRIAGFLAARLLIPAA